MFESISLIIFLMIEIMIEMGVYEISLLKRPINTGFFSMKKGRWCPVKDPLVSDSTVV